MKAILIFCTILFLSGTSIAQEKQPVIISNKKIVLGKTASGEDIMATTYTIPYRIIHWEVDTQEQLLMFVLRKGNVQGYFGAFDMKTGKPVWFNKISGGNFGYVITRNYFLHNLPTKSICYNKATGEKLWSTKMLLATWDEETNTFITATGEGLDMRTGNSKWKANMDGTYGWGNVAYLDSNNILIGAAGVNKIDLRNGTYAWFKTSTGSTNYTRMAITNTLGIAAGILTGSFFYAGGPDVVTNACSNILVNDNRIYFASMEHISCLDRGCNKIWSIDLPKHTGSSSLLVKGNNVYLINLGYATMAGRSVPMAKAYIAAYDKATGKQKYLTTPETGVINKIFIDGDTATLVGPKEALRYTMSDGNIFAKRTFENDDVPYRYFVRGENFYKKDQSGKYISLAQLYPNHVFASNNDGQLLHMNSTLDSLDKMDKDVYFLRHIEKGPTTIIEDKDGMTRILKDGVETIKLQTKDPRIIGNTLFDMKESEFTIADIGMLF